jgi:hypothetical protein
MLSRVRPVLGFLVLFLALAGISPAGAATSTAPRVGECHQLSLTQLGADADARPSVRCSARHNLQTVAVATSPTSLVGTTLEERQSLGLRLCLPLVNRALGRTAAKRALSAYTVIYFSPSNEQIAAGARWFRCDVGLKAGARLARLPGRLRLPVLPRRLNDDVRLCLTARGRGTTCSRFHSYRSYRTYPMVADSTAPYPTSDDFLSSASRRCGSDFDWATWPGPHGWDAGDRNVVCFHRTRS